MPFFTKDIPLHEAAFVGDKEVVYNLVKEGADTEARNNKGVRKEKRRCIYDISPRCTVIETTLNCVLMLAMSPLHRKHPCRLPHLMVIRRSYRILLRR